MAKTKKKLRPDFSSLSKEEKLELLSKFEEKERRDRERRGKYIPNEGQDKVHRSIEKIRLVTSGNGAGKTCLGIHEAFWWAEGFNPITKEFTPVPAKICVVLDHPDKVADPWFEEIRVWYNLREDQLRKNGRPYVNQILFDNGSYIQFMFHEQGELKFESVQFDYVIFDEPPPRWIYKALGRGQRKKHTKPRTLFLGTPIVGAWLRKEILVPWQKGELPHTECFKFGTKVNKKHINMEEMNQYFSTLTEKERRIREDGEFFDLEGLALSGVFNPEIHVVNRDTWKADCPVVIAIDPHKVKPHHAIMLGCDRDNYLYVIKELKVKALAADFGENHLKPWMKGFKVVDIIMDSMGKEPYTGGNGNRSFYQELKALDIEVRVTSFEDKDQEDFVDRIQTALAIPLKPDNYGQYTPKLRIFAHCVGTITDIENVQWVKRKHEEVYKPKLEIDNRDFLACLKYAMASNPTYTKYKAKIYRPLNQRTVNQTESRRRNRAVSYMKNKSE